MFLDWDFWEYDQKPMKERVILWVQSKKSRMWKCKCFMMEYDPKYADVIIDRWQELTGQKAKLINQIV